MDIISETREFKEETKMKQGGSKKRMIFVSSAAVQKSITKTFFKRYFV